MLKENNRLFEFVSALDPFQETTRNDVSLRHTIAAVAVPVVAIVAAESLAYTGNVQLGLGVYVLLLLFCTLYPLIRPSQTALLQGFVLIPVFRLVNLGMPAFVELTLYWLPLVYAPMLLAIALVVRSNPLVPVSVGWRIGLITLPIAAAMGIMLAQVEYALAQPEALLPALDPLGTVLLGVVMIGTVAVVEEALFRGVIQTILEEEIGAVAGILLASALFAVLYAGGAAPPMLPFALALGLFYGIVFHQTRSLLAVVAIHGTANLFLYGVFPLWGPLVEVPLPI